ncbi:YkgJ family cysteine cluster protein [Pseudomonas sp. ME-P-057]|uniref:YkgJ family cysteine cluster protein n=1 Tax=Pseudomonas sp. ME-P-057 TaxID=3040321 RepID=UPI0025572ADC|nr:YkgJ family cysteine cluster protein [Pseudomonas sp. ME-P-057]
MSSDRSGESSTHSSAGVDSNERFACVGCGACCRGRFVPLTLNEAVTWLKRGHGVAVMLEAFDESLWPAGSPEFTYNAGRSAAVPCASGTLRVTVILAANALPECPNLQQDGLCGIYLERPLVCRIYPMEINPFIRLEPAAKDCPPESWEQGTLLASDQGLATLVQQSRQADRDDALRKVALCESLGLMVAGWKGNGLVIHQPSVEDLLAACENIDENAVPASSAWQIRADDASLVQYLKDHALPLADPATDSYIFHSTR